MAKIVYSLGRQGPRRYESEWQGERTGTWYHSAWHRYRWTAVIYAFFASIDTPHRVLDHGPDEERRWSA